MNNGRYRDFYDYVFNNENIAIDATNNANPKRLIVELTGYAKAPRKGFKKIQNYQISHVFGRTKNALAFTAPWNIVYLPKLLDPFTGHEAKGGYVTEFTYLFQNKCFQHFENLIVDFNEIMGGIIEAGKLEEGIEYVSTKHQLSDSLRSSFSNSVYSEFSQINVSNKS